MARMMGGGASVRQEALTATVPTELVDDNSMPVPATPHILWDTQWALHDSAEWGKWEFNSTQATTNSTLILCSRPGVHALHTSTVTAITTADLLQLRQKVSTSWEVGFVMGVAANAIPANDGLPFLLRLAIDSAGTVSWSLGSGSGDRRIEQAGFNLDTVDGRGPSGMNLSLLARTSTALRLQVVIRVEPRADRTRIGVIVANKLAWIHVVPGAFSRLVRAYYRYTELGPSSLLLNGLVGALAFTNLPHAAIYKGGISVIIPSVSGVVTLSNISSSNKVLLWLRNGTEQQPRSLWLRRLIVQNRTDDTTAEVTVLRGGTLTFTNSFAFVNVPDVTFGGGHVNDAYNDGTVVCGAIVPGKQSVTIASEALDRPIYSSAQYPLSWMIDTIAVVASTVLPSTLSPVLSTRMEFVVL
jgi:hypothetical protein